MAKEMSDSEAQRLEKLKILQSTLDKIEKNYGKGSVMKLGDHAAEKVDVISTGSINLDAALGVGGFPKGRIIEIFGRRYCRLYRCRACLRQFLCQETRCGY